MALFNKRQSLRGNDPIIVVTGAELKAARKGLLRFEQVTADGQDATPSVTALSIAAGVPDLVGTTQALIETGEFDFNRLWNWLADVAGEAEDRGDFDLVAHIALFFTHWTITPEMHELTLASQIQMRVNGPPPTDILADVLTTAFESLPQMSPESMILDFPSITMTAGQLLLACAQVALDQEDMVPDLVEIAQGIIDNPDLGQREQDDGEGNGDADDQFRLLRLEDALANLIALSLNLINVSVGAVDPDLDDPAIQALVAFLQAIQQERSY